MYGANGLCRCCWSTLTVKEGSTRGFYEEREDHDNDDDGKDGNVSFTTVNLINYHYKK